MMHGKPSNSAVPARLEGNPYASVEIFGTLPTGEPVQRINLRTVRRDGGFSGVSILTQGAAIQQLWVPDREGQAADVVLGFDDVDGYLGRNPCFGAVPGRYANRLSHGAFTLEGQACALDINWKGHTLHGGTRGFHTKLWKIAKGPWVDMEGAYVTLSTHSPAGDQGFRAAVDVSVTYRWTMCCEVEIEFSASADRATVVNLTNHSYFNLAGVDKGSDVLDHELEIAAEHITEVDGECIPTGRIIDVHGTPFDFREPRRIGEKIADVPGGGYDHNYCVSGDHTTGLKRFVARLRERHSGRCMEVWSTQPGVQLFTANEDVVDGIQGKLGVVYPRHAAVCLETQHYPDSPNHDNFPNTTLTPARTYFEAVAYRFRVSEED